ncbi:hypothetical protein CALVIDRAFT_596828 [Calocera viscosa TUFC12733]|uniref:Uncharacterized protein n=1 Tax=Calocera viscosa (strain TUFC12733) TaxID=1330018 RepID=A0A167P075_CALVF|nr:hypothetical protein CALVIDRAFT_596828 [Calocera viscosa TUFC12733]
MPMPLSISQMLDAALPSSPGVEGSTPEVPLVSNAGLSASGEGWASATDALSTAGLLGASPNERRDGSAGHVRTTSVASITSSTSNSASDTSEETKVDETELRPRPLRRRPRTHIIIPVPAELSTAPLKQGSLLGEAERDSPVEGIAGHDQLDAQDARQGGNLSPTDSEYLPSYYGLDSEADMLLKDCFQLLPEQPTSMSSRVYQKPAGEYFGPIPIPQPSSDNLRRPPHRAMSGIFRSEDDIDRDIGCVEPRTLSTWNWEEHETPDGYPYFRHKILPFVTDDYLRIIDNLEQVDKWSKYIYGMILLQMKNTTCGYSWPAKWELYLRVENGTHPVYDFDGPLCYYYLIDMNKREVFWLHSFDNYSEVIADLPLHASSKLIRLHLQLEFWAHMEIFSGAEAVPKAEKELRDMLLWAAFDQTTSPTNSTCPFEKGQPEQFLGVLDQFKGEDEDSPVKNVAVARLMGTCYKSRIFNRFGDHGARIDRSQPSLRSEEGKPPLLKLFAYCLMHGFVMGGDRWYLDKIRMLTVDGYVPPQAWKDLVKMLVETSNQSTLIVAALLFTGNIGFLSINNLVWDQIIISIVATLLSLGSLFVGLQQVLHHYDLKESSALTGSQYCYAASRSWLGYRGLAVYYSLPNALLVWSAVATVAALLVWCFQSVELGWIASGWTIAILLGLAFIGIAALRFSRRLFAASQGEKKAHCGMMILLTPLWWAQRKLGWSTKGEQAAEGEVLNSEEQLGEEQLKQQEGRASPDAPAAEPPKKRGSCPVAWVRGTVGWFRKGKQAKQEEAYDEKLKQQEEGQVA